MYRISRQNRDVSTVPCRVDAAAAAAAKRDADADAMPDRPAPAGEDRDHVELRDDEPTATSKHQPVVAHFAAAHELRARFTRCRSSQDLRARRVVSR